MNANRDPVKYILAAISLFACVAWSDEPAPAEPKAIPMDQLGVEAQK